MLSDDTHNVINLFSNKKDGPLCLKEDSSEIVIRRGVSFWKFPRIDFGEN